MLIDQETDVPEVQNPRLLRLIACPYLALEHGRIDRYVPEGETIAGHLRALGWQPEGLSARVFLDGRLIEQAQWEYTVPAGGQSLVARVIPMGGDEGGKTALRIVGMIAVVVAAAFTGGAAGGAVGSFFGVSANTGAALAMGAVSIAGSLALGALIPPARPRLPELSGQATSSPTLSLTGSRNQFAPYAPIPRVYGRHRIYPPLAAMVFTEVVGTDQYLRALFLLGYGPLALSDFKIGETALDLFEDVEMEVRSGYPDEDPFTLFPNDVYEDALSIALTQAADWEYRTSQSNARELSWDVTFPEGLVEYTAQGNAQDWTVQLEVEARLVGDVSWTTVNDVAAVAASGQPGFGDIETDLVYTAVTPGTRGNGIVIVYQDRGVQASESVEVYEDNAFIDTGTYLGYATTIVVVLRYDGVTYSTAAQVKTAVEAANISGLITVAFPGVATGSLPVEPMEYFYLGGGRQRVTSFQITDRRATQVRASLRWQVPTEGQYETRIRRISGDFSSSLIRDDTYWTMLRTIQSTSPVSKNGMAGVALRIRATGQLNGTLDTFNCIAHSILPDWDGTQWVDRPTSNPASIYRDVLQGSANKRPKADSRLDLTTIQDFHERCEADGFAFNAVIDFRTTVKQLRQDVLAAGRGTFGLRDMQYSVIQDLVQATPAHILTPRNSSNFRWSKRFLDPVHALKVRFVDEDNDWQQGERTVYADGYTAANATIFEDTDAGLGVTNSDQVYKLKRRELAEAFLRADDYAVDVDFEQLLFTRGDRVQVQADVILAGLLSARIVTVTVNGGGDATAIMVDDLLVMETGTSYGVRIARADGTQSVHELVTVAGESASVTFATVIPVATVPAIGDLCIFGELGQESLDCIVKAIVPTTDYAATVTLLDYAPDIQTADSGTIPPWNSHVTLPSLNRRLIAPPIIERVLSDESVLLRDADGSYQSRILIILGFASGFRFPASRVEAHYRLSDSTSDWLTSVASVSGLAAELAILPVQDGETYDLRLRSIDDYSWAASAWVTIEGHMVIGKTTLPPNVTGLTFDSDGIRWAYPDAPLDLAGFLIRVRPGLTSVWDDAFQLNDVPVTSTTYPVIPDGSTRVIMVKAVDVAGNESETAAWILQDAAALVLDNLAETYDLQDLGFPGTLTDCTVVSDELTADSLALFWSNDTALFWSSDSALFWNGSYSDMSYLFTVTPPAKWLAGTLRTQVGISAQGWTLDYRPSSTALFWSSDSALFWSSDAALFWSAEEPAFTTWPGALERPKRQNYEFRLSAVGGTIQGVVSLLRVLYDMPDLREAFADLTLPVGGARIPLTKTFQVITAVAATPRYDGGALTRLQTYDLQLSPGPLLIGYDADGALAAGVAGGTVDGY